MGFGAGVSGVTVGWWRGGRGWGFYYGSCGFMVVKVGGCRGDGGGRVAVRFLGCCEVFVRFVEES